jgi:hypothetical protein
MLVLTLWLTACGKPEAGSPEAVADQFAHAYFGLADQQKAKKFTAFGATKMLEREIAEVRDVRQDGYTPGAANIDVGFERGQRSQRGERVRFDYVIRYQDRDGAQEKHADIELALVEGAWKVVRVGLANKTAPAASR